MKNPFRLESVWRRRNIPASSVTRQQANTFHAISIIQLGAILDMEMLDCHQLLRFFWPQDVRIVEMFASWNGTDLPKGRTWRQLRMTRERHLLNKKYGRRHFPFHLKEPLSRVHTCNGRNLESDHHKTNSLSCSAHNDASPHHQRPFRSVPNDTDVSRGRADVQLATASFVPTQISTCWVDCATRFFRQWNPKEIMK